MFKRSISVLLCTAAAAGLMCMPAAAASTANTDVPETRFSLAVSGTNDRSVTAQAVKGASLFEAAAAADEVREDIQIPQIPAEEPDVPSPDPAPAPDAVPLPDGLNIRVVGTGYGVYAEIRSGMPYVSLADMAQALGGGAEVSFDEDSGTLTAVTRTGMTISAADGENCAEANGRCLYVPSGVEQSGSDVLLPLDTAAALFGAASSWDPDSQTAYVAEGNGVIESGDSFYDANYLFWLSRVIYLEAGNQSLECMISVGNAVMNRVVSPDYPDTIEEVLAQKNQFTTWQSGALRNAVPTAKAVRAAKLVLEGTVIESTRGALYFDSCEGSWASRNRPFLTTIGAMNFYG